MSTTIFGPGFQRLEAALIAREKAQSVHAANIANADTPNYRVDRRSFADFLAAQLQQTAQGRLDRTHPLHLQADAQSSLMVHASSDEVQTMRMDGNTVDTQKEMAHMAEDQLMHELTLRLLKGRLNGLANAIKEGGR